MTVSVKQMKEFVEESGYSVTLDGPDDIAVDGFCALNNPKPSSITWVKKAASDSLAGFDGLDGCIVVSREVIPTTMRHCCFILTDEPKGVFFSILHKFWGDMPHWGIESDAIVLTDNLPHDVYIGHHTYIGDDVTIGEGTVIEHNVTIYHRATIGRNCIIHSGVVIGTDGFGYYMDDDGCPVKVEHFGGVTIGDDVEIGANTCVDRGTIDDTIIGDRVKIDNLVQIAHNDRIGKGALIVGGVMLGGSARIGERAYLATGAIVKNQLEVGDGSFVGMDAVVSRSVPAGRALIEKRGHMTLDVDIVNEMIGK